MYDGAVNVSFKAGDGGDFLTEGDYDSFDNLDGGFFILNFYDDLKGANLNVREKLLD